MNRRVFLLPFAATVSALLGLSPSAATANNAPRTDGAMERIGTTQIDRLGDLVIERASLTVAQDSGHSSHASHSSHSSHVSHASHQSSAN